MMLWLDSEFVRPPRNYFPLTMRFRRAVHSVNWWRVLGLLLCMASGVVVVITIAAMGDLING